MNRRYKYVLFSILALLTLLLASLIFMYINDIPETASNPSETYEDNSSGKEILVLYVGNDLNNIYEYESVINLKTLFKYYENIVFKMYDSKGDKNIQSLFLEDAAEDESKVIILNPVDYNEIWPQVKMLSEAEKSVVMIGNFSINPHYKSIGYSPLLTGKMFIQSIEEKISEGGISIVAQNTTNQVSSEILRGITKELKKHPDISVTDIINISKLTDNSISHRLDKLLTSDAILIIDTENFDLLYSLLVAKGYTGIIVGVTQSYEHLAYIIDNDKLTFIFKEPEVFNEKLFEILLNIFNNKPESPHFQAQQTIINDSNIEKYIND